MLRRRTMSWQYWKIFPMSSHIHFSKRAPHWNFSIFSYPQSLLPDWFSKTSWTKNKSRKCRLKIYFTHVPSAISPSRWPRTSKRTWFSMMKKHVLAHSGEKPFACKQCNYSFTQAANLKRHALLHGGAKPVVCKQCKFSCTTPTDLKRHMLTKALNRYPKIDLIR